MAGLDVPEVGGGVVEGDKSIDIFIISVIIQTLCVQIVHGRYQTTYNVFRYYMVDIKNLFKYQWNTSITLWQTAELIESK